MAISVDNASENDSAIEFLRKTFAKKDNCLLNGKWIHIRCAAHILNLVVQDGIKSVDKAIENIRYADKDKIMEKEEDSETMIIDSSEDEGNGIVKSFAWMSAYDQRWRCEKEILEKGKGKFKDRKKVPSPPKKESVGKDAECFHSGKIGHLKRNCPSYLVELKQGYALNTVARILNMVPMKKVKKSTLYEIWHGSIMCAMTFMRPNVSYALSMTDKFRKDHGEKHWTAVENILRHHYICEVVSLQNVEVIKVHIDDNTVDPLMKALSCDKHEFHVNGMGLHFVGLDSSYFNSCIWDIRTDII
ncbi:zinc finger BED domain-containing protein RICESLEEPER 2-like protein [Tanacetum coccineum]